MCNNDITINHIESQCDRDIDYIELAKKLKSLPNYVLTEKDFYPPEDKRKLCSGVRDINGGDNFHEFSELFYDMYENELFDN